MAVEGGSADTNDFGDGFHGVFAAGVHLLGDGEFVWCECWWPSADASSGSRCGETGHGAISDEISFELGERSEEMEHELSA